jgi:MtN3 and saliva related transmembrane protein
MFDVTLLGYVAAFCTTCSFVPQVVCILKTRDTRSISIGMYTTFVMGVFLWLIYGMYVRDTPIIVANAITLLLAAIILALKIRDVLKEKKLSFRGA